MKKACLNGIFGGMDVLVESEYNRSHEEVKRVILNDAFRSPADVTTRLDRLIKDIRTRFHDSAIGKPKSEAPISDVLIVAHGHILRAFAMRWIGRELTSGVSLLLEGSLFPRPTTPNLHVDSLKAGGVGTLR